MSRSVLAWALSRALRLAIGTCVVGLLLATTLSGDAAERFATAAYLAAIFAAFTLVLGRFFPYGAEERRVVSAVFPAFLSYSLGVVIFLSAMALLVSDPRTELLVLIVAVALIGTAVLIQSGTVSAFNAVLARGGFLVAISRYAAITLVAALVLAATFGGGDVLVGFAFRLTILATLAIGLSLFATTTAGLWVRRRYVQTLEELDRLSRAFVFERTAIYAAVVAVTAMIAAGVLPQAWAQAFGIVAYVAAVAAAFGVAMECRRLRS